MRSTPREEPHLGSIKLSRSVVFGWLLYLLLMLAAVAALLRGTQPQLVPPIVGEVAPFAFAAFLGLFAVYRFALVRARRYPAGRAFFQIAVGAAFLMLLTLGRPPRAGGGLGPERPQEFGDRMVRPSGPRTLESLMVDLDPAVRSLACEVARHRANGRAYARLLAARLSDRVPAVRSEALASLRSLAGSDIGGNGDDFAERWAEWAAGQPPAGP